MDTVFKLTLLGLFGALGTLCRYGVNVLGARLLGLGFPYGTMIVNLLGCFLFGVIAGLAESRGFVHPELRGLLLVGFMGAFTTFSSLIFDSYSLYESQALGLAFLNILGQIIFGFVALWLGLRTSGLL